jgi:hypothetical protein
VIRVLPMICILASALALAACGSAQDLTESSAAAAVPAASANAPTPPAQTGTSNGKTYDVTTTSVDGFSPDGLGTWKAMRGQLEGGDPAVVKAFNDASQAVARGQLARALSAAKDGAAWTFEASGQVTFRHPVIAQVISSAVYIGSDSSTEAEAVVIDSRTARPVMLADVFAKESAGLDRLSRQTKILLPRTIGSTSVMLDEPGNAPRRENFANWIPTADGMELHFSPHQFKMNFVQTITVPWAQLTDLLAPRMADIAKS